jgi:hypothetical protein
MLAHAALAAACLTAPAALSGCLTPRDDGEVGAQAVPAEAAAAVPARRTDGLPAARGPLQMPLRGGLALVVRRFGDLTGQHVVMDEATRARLEEADLGVDGGFAVPPADVWTFVENLLFEKRFVIASLAEERTGLLAVYSLDVRRGSQAIGSWITVAPEDIAGWTAHPALLAQTVIEIPNDVRLAANSLRGLLSDSSYQAALPVGEHGLLLRGTGRQVAQWAEILRSAARSEPAGAGRR